MTRAAAAIETVLLADLATAMNRFNRDSAPESEGDRS